MGSDVDSLDLSFPETRDLVEGSTGSKLESRLLRLVGFTGESLDLSTEVLDSEGESFDLAGEPT